MLGACGLELLLYCSVGNGGSTGCEMMEDSGGTRGDDVVTRGVESGCEPGESGGSGVRGDGGGMIGSNGTGDNSVIESGCEAGDSGGSRVENEAAGIDAKINGTARGNASMGNSISAGTLGGRIVASTGVDAVGVSTVFAACLSLCLSKSS